MNSFMKYLLLMMLFVYSSCYYKTDQNNELVYHVNNTILDSIFYKFNHSCQTLIIDNVLIPSPIVTRYDIHTNDSTKSINLEFSPTIKLTESVKKDFLVENNDKLSSIALNDKFKSKLRYINLDSIGLDSYWNIYGDTCLIRLSRVVKNDDDIYVCYELYRLDKCCYGNFVIFNIDNYKRLIYVRTEQIWAS